MRTSHRLAVDRDDFICGSDSDRLHPLDESFVESHGSDQRKDPGNGIVELDAVFQLEKGLEPIFVRSSNASNSVMFSASQMKARIAMTMMSLS